MRAWLLLAAALLGSALALLAVSVSLVRLDEREVTNEQTRLALWRMELVLSRVVAAESARPSRFDISPSGELSGELLARYVPQLTARDQTELPNNFAADFTRRNILANAPDPEPSHSTQLSPMWIDDALFLVRREYSGEGVHTRGVMLDWPALRRRLLREVTDLLPEAELRPARAATPDAALLASMPLELVPGRPARSETRAPVRDVLLAAWGAWAVVAFALVVLVHRTRALDKRRKAFVSAVTHELRTPLTTFKLYAEMLEGGMVPADQQSLYLARLRQEANRLGYLVENVLAWAQVERGRRRKPLEDVACDELLDTIVPRLSQRAELGSFTLDVGDLPTLRVRADRISVEQVLFNLVDNACKYAARSDARRIALTCAVQESRLELTVADDGPGVAAEVARKLFEPMQKSASESANGAHGIGLGLALSRQLARAMGGELASRPAPQGAQFVLTLPLAEAVTRQ
ncbi:MAG: HAMP domain-containing sensor histidine kinase [Archangium sp.]